MKTKLFAIGTLGLLTVLSLGRNFNNVNAIDMVDPYNYDWKYDYDSITGVYELTTPDAGSTGARINYTNPSGTNYETSDFLGKELTNGEVFPLNLEIYFGLSTTTWGFASGNYYPTGSFIGSNSTTSSDIKVYFILDNPTPDNWYVGLNLSDSVATSWVANLYSGYSVSNGEPLGWTSLTPVDVETRTFTRSASGPNIIEVPPFTQIEVGTNGNTINSVYLRSMWFKLGGNVNANGNYDDGYNAGFENGYTQGYDDGTDAGGSSVPFRISILLNQVFGGVRNVLNVKIFDQLTIGTVMLFPFAFVIVSFIFRLVRGGRS